MTGIDKQQMRVECQKLYVTEGKTLVEISKIKDIPTSTLSRWKITDNWETNRKTYMSSNSEIRKQTDEVITDLLKTIKDTDDINMKIKLFDGLSKVVKTKKEANDFIDKRSAVFCVMDWFSKYINEVEKDKDIGIKIQTRIYDFLLKAEEEFK